MKIPAPSYGQTPAPSLWPSTKAGVLEIAQGWYQPGRVAVNERAIAGLELPAIAVGAEPSMAAGKLGMDWGDNVALSLALNSINYQFWDLDAQGGFQRYSFNGTVGAMGMREAFENAWFDPTSALSRARRGGYVLTAADVQGMFGDLPALDTRVNVLNEVLQPPTLARLTQELTEELARTGQASTPMAKRIADAFPIAYGDAVLKKAQLAVSEIWVKARAEGHRIDCDLTAFADYQIPNILRAMGVLDYAPDLAERIDALQPIGYNSPDEQAIRAASLLAVERIAERAGVPVAAVDHYLWMRRKEATTPFHLTFTTAY